MIQNKHSMAQPSSLSTQTNPPKFPVNYIISKGLTIGLFTSNMGMHLGISSKPIIQLRMNDWYLKNAKNINLNATDQVSNETSAAGPVPWTSCAPKVNSSFKRGSHRNTWRAQLGVHCVHH